MNNFGIMSLSLDHENHYIHQMAKYGHDLGFTLYHFVPSTYHPFTHTVKGKKYLPESDAWLESEFPVPTILYDRCFYHDDSHSIQCKNIIQWLKKQPTITFIGNGLPNKWELYQILRESKLAAYIPETFLLQSVNQVNFQSLNPVIIKPINGSQGNGLYFIEKSKEGILVRTDKKEQTVEKIFSDRMTFNKWLNQLLKRSSYLMQAYLPLSNQEKQPFDIRALLQKNTQAEWKVIEKGVRIGEKGRIISNLSAGASIYAFEEWFRFTPFKLKSFLKQEMEEIFTLLPSILENSFSALFEIGVDIGITPDGSLWILDVNSKPGRKVIMTAYPHLCEKLYKAPVLYAAKLADDKRRNLDEKAISYRNNH
ncbi:MAG: YheC/YheD family protein [Niallia nealsonii]|nr:YheC/YheD family protein [Niallia nealsonii]